MIQSRIKASLFVYTYRKMLNLFISKENEMFLFFVKNSGRDEYKISTEPFVFGEKKGMSFIKSRPLKITSENIDEVVFYEEIAGDPLKHASLVLEEVYLPLLKNGKNQRNWPKVVSQDVMRQFHRFTGTLDLFIGQTQGTVVLPIPPLEDLNTEKAEDDRGLLHSLESAVIDWSREIKVC
jgi:dynein heavy chain